MINTLEQKANETEIEIRPCHECGVELRIPKGISLQKGKEYAWGYVSSLESIFCNKRYCFDDGFTQT